MKELICIGVGPGEEKYLTLEAISKIKEADHVFVISNKGTTRAYDVIKNYAKNKKTHILECPMLHMSEEKYRENMKLIEDTIGEGEIGVFPVIGDGTIFSTFFNTIRENKKDDLKISSVAGIPSFIAAANKLMFSIINKNEKFILLEGNKEIEEKDIRDMDSIAILKLSKDKKKILDLLEKNNFRYVYISYLGYDNEFITEKRELIERESNYFSMLLCRKNK